MSKITTQQELDTALSNGVVQARFPNIPERAYFITTNERELESVLGVDAPIGAGGKSWFGIQKQGTDYVYNLYDITSSIGGFITLEANYLLGDSTELEYVGSIEDALKLPGTNLVYSQNTEDSVSYDLPYNPTALEKLVSGVVKVEFYKKDGSHRVMYCTLSSSIIKGALGNKMGSEAIGTITQSNNRNNMYVDVFDVEKLSPRKINLDTLAVGVESWEVYKTIDEALGRPAPDTANGRTETAGATEEGGNTDIPSNLIEVVRQHGTARNSKLPVEEITQDIVDSSVDNLRKKIAKHVKSPIVTTLKELGYEPTTQKALTGEFLALELSGGGFLSKMDNLDSANKDSRLGVLIEYEEIITSNIKKVNIVQSDATLLTKIVVGLVNKYKPQVPALTVESITSRISKGTIIMHKVSSKFSLREYATSLTHYVADLVKEEVALLMGQVSRSGGDPRVLGDSQDAVANQLADLSDNVVRITFVKTNGELRVLWGTRNATLIDTYYTDKPEPKYDESGNEIRRPAPTLEEMYTKDVVSVFDLEAKSWRSYKPSMLGSSDENGYSSWQLFNINDDAWFKVVIEGESDAPYLTKGRYAKDTGVRTEHREEYETAITGVDIPARPTGVVIDTPGQLEGSMPGNAPGSVEGIPFGGTSGEVVTTGNGSGGSTVPEREYEEEDYEESATAVDPGQSVIDRINKLKTERARILTTVLSVSNAQDFTEADRTKLVTIINLMKAQAKGRQLPVKTVKPMSNRLFYVDLGEDFAYYISPYFVIQNDTEYGVANYNNIYPSAQGTPSGEVTQGTSVFLSTIKEIIEGDTTTSTGNDMFDVLGEITGEVPPSVADTVVQPKEVNIYEELLNNAKEMKREVESQISGATEQIGTKMVDLILNRYKSYLTRGNGEITVGLLEGYTVEEITPHGVYILRFNPTSDTDEIGVQYYIQTPNSKFMLNRFTTAGVSKDYGKYNAYDVARGKDNRMTPLPKHDIPAYSYILAINKELKNLVAERNRKLNKRRKLTYGKIYDERDVRRLRRIQILLMEERKRLQDLKVSGEYSNHYDRDYLITPTRKETPEGTEIFYTIAYQGQDGNMQGLNISHAAIVDVATGQHYHYRELPSTSLKDLENSLPNLPTTVDPYVKEVVTRVLLKAVDLRWKVAKETDNK